MTHFTVITCVCYLGGFGGNITGFWMDLGVLLHPFSQSEKYYPGNWG